MTEQISSIVQKIQSKFQDLHHELVSEREKNLTLVNELGQTKTLFSANQAQIFQLEEQVRFLQSELIRLNEQLSSQKSLVEINKDAEIDELVREIEHCISQLKQ
jgi:predicted  nucleic acid-binding Zn-ribbon protein